MNGDKTAIFIDGGYLDKTLQNSYGGRRIDFSKFPEVLLKPDDSLFRTYYYHCLPYISSNPTEEEKYRYSQKSRFFEALSNLPRFSVRLGQLVFRGKTEAGKPIFTQKLVDIMFSVDLVELAATRQINRVVLLAADNDFVPAVESVKRSGVIVSLLFYPGNGFRKTRLWEISDERIEFNDELINRVGR